MKKTTTRNYRVQNRGHNPKYPIHARDTDNDPSSERIRLDRSGLATTAQPIEGLTTSARIERKIAASQDRPWEQSIASTVGELLGDIGAYNNPSGEAPRVRVNDLGRLTVTYYGTHTLRPALADKYPNFEKDLKQTRDILTKFKGDFMAFVMQSAMLQSEME